MDIKYFTSKIKQDPNHVYEHAIVNNDDRVEFVKCPYQPYVGKSLDNSVTAYISKFYNPVRWIANIYRSRLDGTGNSDCIGSFKNEDKDFVFSWAYRQLVPLRDRIHLIR